jgi:hypothetical protein
MRPPWRPPPTHEAKGCTQNPKESWRTSSPRWNRYSQRWSSCPNDAGCQIRLRERFASQLPGRLREQIVCQFEFNTSCKAALSGRQSLWRTPSPSTGLSVPLRRHQVATDRHLRQTVVASSRVFAVSFQRDSFGSPLAFMLRRELLENGGHRFETAHRENTKETL